jgi:hypothetical protein
VWQGSGQRRFAERLLRFEWIQRFVRFEWLERVFGLDGQHRGHAGLQWRLVWQLDVERRVVLVRRGDAERRFHFLWRWPAEWWFVWCALRWLVWRRPAVGWLVVAVWFFVWRGRRFAGLSFAWIELWRWPHGWNRDEWQRHLREPVGLGLRVERIRRERVG